MPRGLELSHRIAAGTWGLIHVHEGSLQFLAQTRAELRVVIRSDMTQAVPPEVEHRVQTIGTVRFSIEFLSILEERQPLNDPVVQKVTEAGGESACLAHLLCPECGVVLDSGSHRKC